MSKRSEAEKILFYQIPEPRELIYFFLQFINERIKFNCMGDISATQIMNHYTFQHQKLTLKKLKANEQRNK